MLEGLYSAAAGMSAQQRQMDVISDDLSNVSTTGYKAERVAFSDLLYSRVEQAGASTTVGAGASAQVIGRDNAEGAIGQTGKPLDLAIEGEGFFQVRRANGEVALTRDGAFDVDARGRLTSADGSLVVPPITLPAGTSPGDVVVSADGAVSAGTRTLGKIALVTVPAPDKLLADGKGELTPNAASGAPRPARGSRILQGALESSNVDMASEMVAMMGTQRSYQLASSAIKTEDQMMSIANQLRA